MGANRLQLNAAKTDILWCSSQRRVDQLPSHHFSSVGPSSVVRNLGVRIDVGLTMSTHITKVVAGCFASLRQLRMQRDTAAAAASLAVSTRTRQFQTASWCIALLHGLGPEYFSEDFRKFRFVSEIHSRQRLRSASSTDV